MTLTNSLQPRPGADRSSPLVGRDLSKRYRPEGRLVVDRVDVRVERGEWLAIMGPSGCGKSTLLQMLGGLTTPSAGTVELAGVSFSDRSESQRARLRRCHVGYVFQRYNLIDELRVVDDVSLPLRLNGTSARRARGAATELLERLGLAHAAQARPGELSGGEQQRAAIARALVGQPDIVLADEPTGALDSVAAQHVIELMTDASARGQTIVMVTHDASVAGAAHRLVHMTDGHLHDGDGHVHGIGDRSTVAR
jgi:putative ABC transport system ATP-binding protein